MRSRLRVTAADQAVDLLAGERPVDLGLILSHEPLETGPLFRLRPEHRFAARNESHGLRQGLLPQRIEFLEVERPGGVSRRDPHPPLLNQQWARVDPLVGPKHTHAGLFGAEDDLPRKRRTAAKSGQQRRMEAERAVFRCRDDLGWQEHRGEGHQVQVGTDCSVFVHAFRDGLALAAKMAVAHQRPASLDRQLGQGIGP